MRVVVFLLGTISSLSGLGPCYSAELHAELKSELTAAADVEKELLPLPHQQPANLPEYSRTPFLCLSNKLFRFSFNRDPWTAKVVITRGPTTGFAVAEQGMPHIETVGLDKTSKDSLRSGLTFLRAQVESHQKMLEFLSFGSSGASLPKKVAWFSGPLRVFSLVVGVMRADKGYNEFAESVKVAVPKIIEGLGEGSSVARVLVVIAGSGGRTYLRDSRTLVNPNGSTFELQRCYYLMKPK